MAPPGGVAAPEDDYHPKAGVYVANSSWGEFAGYSASIVANKSIAWLREVAGKGKPFMLTVSRTILPVIFRALLDDVRNLRLLRTPFPDGFRDSEICLLF